MVKEETMLEEEHKRHKQRVLKEAWTQEQDIRKTRDLADQKYLKLLLWSL